MMRGSVLCGLLLAAAAGPLAAQVEGDSHPGVTELRERIERRFADRVKRELGLSEEQATKLKSVATEHGGYRKDLRHRERALRAALERQIRNGATANPDSVARLTKDLLDLRVQYAESWRDEMDELRPFLTPVQRAQLLVLRERLLQRVHEMRDDHRDDHRGFRHRGDGH